MSFGVLVHLESLEILKLVEAQEAVFPQLGVVNGPFIEHQFTADHAVARNGVALKLNARYVERLAFVDINIPRDGFLIVVVGRLGDSAKVDVAEGAISLL